ncbi:hypothetical protein [Pantoea dispersa]|uniref:hypothetical protein n=1 Tax=Pantoea dispersa TaxID=59814 RepID=UPI0023A99E57|nr:hypothetical protein [Pantoea dispersa]MDI6636078.1 hypothetical protein [Pantoea dispersa]WEA07800.1 hypothetical protein PWF83_08190 [Pantoea dispersa]
MTSANSRDKRPFPLKIKKGQKINNTGVVYDIGDRTVNKHNNGNMTEKVVKMRGGVVK